MPNDPDDIDSWFDTAVEQQIKSLKANPETVARNGSGSDVFSEWYEVQIQHVKEKNSDLEHNRELRGTYADKVFRYLILYSIFVGLLLILSGFTVYGFTLESGVLSFLVGSTAAAAIGLVFAVTNGLFDGIGKK